MDPLITLLQTLNSLSPLAVIALLATIIWMQVKNKPASETTVEDLKENHLHDLPEMAATLRRIELSLAENFTYIRARLNGPKG